MKAVIIKDLDGEPLYIAQIVEIGDYEFITTQKQCKKNQEKKAKLLDEGFAQLARDIEENAKQIRILKGED